MRDLSGLIIQVSGVERDNGIWGYRGSLVVTVFKHTNNLPNTKTTTGCSYCSAQRCSCDLRPGYT